MPDDGDGPDAPALLRKARHRSVAWLSRREYATGELRDKLCRADFPEAIVDETMQWLADHDLINNQRFCEAFCRRRAGQGYGPRRVIQELRQRGVESHLAEASISATNWLDSAHKAWEKRFRSMPPETMKERAKQQKYLAQRGFSHDIIRSVIQ